MKLSTEIKYFNPKQNFVFIFCSLLLIWSWMLVAATVDKGNDRGFITVLGISILTSLIFALFLSKNKLADFLTSFLFLVISSFLIFVLSITLGLYLEYVTGISWFGFIVPIAASGLLTYLNIRRLLSFPDNKTAFWCLFIIPALAVIGISSLPFYTRIFAHDFGIGFLISIYLTSVFVLIGILCRTKTTDEANGA